VFKNRYEKLSKKYEQIWSENSNKEESFKSFLYSNIKTKYFAELYERTKQDCFQKILFELVLHVNDRRMVEEDIMDFIEQVYRWIIFSDDLVLKQQQMVQKEKLIAKFKNYLIEIRSSDMNIDKESNLNKEITPAVDVHRPNSSWSKMLNSTIEKSRHQNENFVSTNLNSAPAMKIKETHYVCKNEQDYSIMNSSLQSEILFNDKTRNLSIQTEKEDDEVDSIRSYITTTIEKKEYIDMYNTSSLITTNSEVENMIINSISTEEAEDETNSPINDVLHVNDTSSSKTSSNIAEFDNSSSIEDKSTEDVERISNLSATRTVKEEDLSQYQNGFHLVDVVSN
ncbi:unnamed protein product, partial [Didymodactylos carnosus]